MKALADRLNAYEAIAVRGDVEGILSYWTPDIRFLAPGMDLSGDDFFKFFREHYGSGGKTFSWSWEPIEVSVHGDVAYQIGRVHESYQWPNGDPGELHNNFFARWDKQSDGVWKISRWVFGPIDPPTEG